MPFLYFLAQPLLVTLLSSMRYRDAALVMRHVGRRIAELRTERGLTQEQLAERAGVSAGYIRIIEGGRGNLTVHSLVKYATLLDAEPGELLTVPTTETKRGRPASSKVRRKTAAKKTQRAS
jgi:transcriptional regulator with XRE-family HTH domain